MDERNAKFFKVLSKNTEEYRFDGDAGDKTQAQRCRVTLCRFVAEVYSQTLGFTICSCINTQLYHGLTIGQFQSTPQ
jgi:hypothetical protein